jgi:hypothetical protein
MTWPSYINLQTSKEKQDVKIWYFNVHYKLIENTVLYNWYNLIYFLSQWNSVSHEKVSISGCFDRLKDLPIQISF